MKDKRKPDHEGVIAFGPCVGVSWACRGHGTESVDPSTDTLRLRVLCGACVAYLELSAGEPSEGEARTTEDDRIYGMGAAA